MKLDDVVGAQGDHLTRQVALVREIVGELRSADARCAAHIIEADADTPRSNISSAARATIRARVTRPLCVNPGPESRQRTEWAGGGAPTPGCLCDAFYRVGSEVRR